MIAYNKEWLDHLPVWEAMQDAFDDGCITREEQDAVNAKFPVGFYTPNVFIRIGLFILTLIIMLFSFGLLALMFLSSIENFVSGLLIFFSIMGYAALEYMVNVKRHYNSGVDDGLLWGAVFSFIAGTVLSHNLPMLINCIIVFFVALYFTLRFADRLMAIVAFLSLLGIFFYTCVEFGNIAKAVAPFVIMLISAVIYFIVKKVETKRFVLHYRYCLETIMITSLISFYASGNYFVVRELSNNLFHLNLLPGQTIPFGWLFWAFTFIIPVVYIARGIQKKDSILLRVGMLLLAGIVFTVRYYHAILPVESVMTICGVLLIGLGYWLMKYLKEPKYGFTYKEVSKKNGSGKLNIESLVIAQTFSPDTDPGGTKFGGGSFGGGGASGDY
jgi:hypothetical protein